MKIIKLESMKQVVPATDIVISPSSLEYVWVQYCIEWGIFYSVLALLYILPYLLYYSATHLFIFDRCGGSSPAPAWPVDQPTFGARGYGNVRSRGWDRATPSGRPRGRRPCEADSVWCDLGWDDVDLAGRGGGPAGGEWVPRPPLQVLRRGRQGQQSEYGG